MNPVGSSRRRPQIYHPSSAATAKADAPLCLLAVNLHGVRVVGRQDEGVAVGQAVRLHAHILLDQVVLALVGEDHVRLAGAGACSVT